MNKKKKLSLVKDIKHAFFNKLGGKSKGIYKSLNCGLDSSDKKKDILSNLKTVIRKINTRPKKIILLNQIHSSKFYYIDKKTKFVKKKFSADAIITNKKNTPIGVLTADCAPILIHDQKNKMVAAIHAGWKGAYRGVIKNVIKFTISILILFQKMDVMNVVRKI